LVVGLLKALLLLLLLRRFSWVPQLLVLVCLLRKHMKSIKTKTHRDPLKEGEIAQQKEGSNDAQKIMEMNNAEKLS
jgi:hypothetical protein